MDKTFTVTLTEAEGTILLNMIDTALKVDGIKAAVNAVVLTNKLTKAFQEAQVINAVLPMEAKG